MGFKVLSYNINCGSGDRLLMIAEVIRALQPDAVALLEANNQSNTQTLAHALRMHLVSGQAKSEFAVAWLSQLPIERSRNHRLKVLAKTLLEVEIVWQGDVVPLFATHLVHGRTAADATRRVEEVRAILDVLRTRADHPHMLVGDFNAVHPADPVGKLLPGAEQGYVARYPIQQLLEAGYVDCYRELHPDTAGYTYTSHHPWLRLDYIFAAPAMAAHLWACGLSMGQEAQQASDHVPIWAEFR